MSFAKHDVFPEDLIQAARFARVLCHPARIFILKLLHDKGSMSVMELASKIPLSRSTVSQHLSFLRKYGFIDFMEERPYIFYTPESSKIREALDFLAGVCRDCES